MNKLADKETILEIYTLSGMKPYFIEKDWYATQIIQTANQFSHNGIKLIFAGGTSLSKGYHAIKRFSEDLDFKVVNASNLNESQRRDIRHAFIDTLRQISQFKIDDDKIKTRNKGRNTNFEVEHPKQFTTPDFLRPFVQVEVFFDDEDLSFETKQISSLINEYTKEPAETEINCILPFNTAADKFNALSWRIYDKSVDYTLLRHLHDIYALKAYITDKNTFKTRVLHNFDNKDKPRLKDSSITFNDILSQTNQILSEDKAFKNGYDKYVASMSYASKEEQPSFENTLSYFQELSKLF